MCSFSRNKQALTALPRSSLHFATMWGSWNADWNASSTVIVQNFSQNSSALFFLLVLHRFHSYHRQMPHATSWKILHIIMRVNGSPQCSINLVKKAHRANWRVFFHLCHCNDCAICKRKKTPLEDHYDVDACSHLQNSHKDETFKKQRRNRLLSGILSLHDSLVRSRYRMIAALQSGREAEIVEEVFCVVSVHFISELSPETLLRHDGTSLCNSLLNWKALVRNYLQTCGASQ